MFAHASIVGTDQSDAPYVVLQFSYQSWFKRVTLR